MQRVKSPETIGLRAFRLDDANPESADPLLARRLSVFFWRRFEAVEIIRRQLVIHGRLQFPQLIFPCIRMNRRSFEP